MNITNFIAKKKAAFKEKQGMKMKERKQQLEKLRAKKTELASREKLRTDIKKEKKEIRDLQTARFREGIKSFADTIQSIKTGIEKTKGKNKSKGKKQGITKDIKDRMKSNPFIAEGRNPFE